MSTTVFVKQFPGDHEGEINAQEWLQELYDRYPNNNVQVLCNFTAVARGIDIDRFIWYTVIVSK